MRKSTASWLLAGIALGGCTTALKTSAPAEGISQGFSYQLPRVAYDIEVRRVLSACPEFAGQEVRFDVSASAAPRTMPGEVVVVNYLEADSWTKTTDFTLKNHSNGMLKSINATVNDHTADIVKEGVKAAVGVGKIAIGLPGGGGVSTPQSYDGTETYLRCAGPAREMLLGLPGMKTAIKAAEAASKAASKALADLEAASKTGKPAPAKDLAELTKAAREKADALEKAKKSYDDALASLTVIHRTTLDIPENGAEAVLQLRHAVDGKVKPGSLLEIYKPTTTGQHFLIPLDSTLKPDIQAAVPENYPGGQKGGEMIEAERARQAKEIADAAANQSPSRLDETLGQIGNADVTMVASNLAGGSAPKGLDASASCVDDPKSCGVLYRTRALGRMRICVGSGTGAANACISRVNGDPSILFSEERAIPQFGKLMSLPLVNGPFTNNVLTAEFTEDGLITEFSYKKPNAEGQAAAASFNELVTGASEIITYRNGRELRELKEKKELYEAQLAADGAQGKLTPTELQQLKNRKELIEAQIALAEAEKRSQPQQPSEVTKVNNETSLYEAQLARTLKILELRKAQKALADLEKPKTE